MARLLFCLTIPLVLLQTTLTASPAVKVSDASVAVENEGHKLTVSLESAIIDLETPIRNYWFTPNIETSGGWTTPSKAKSAPNVKTNSKAAHVEIVYPVSENREFVLEIDAYKGIPAVFVTSRLRVLDAVRPQYYYWSWNGSFDHYFAPERREVNLKDWTRMGYSEWFFLPCEKGGLAVISRGRLGRGPGDKGEPYLNALPWSRSIAPDESLDAGFGLAAVKTPEDAETLYKQAHKRKIPAIIPSVSKKIAKVDYGQPAPEWLRNADAYNGFYHSADQWNRKNIREKLSHFPLIVGVPHSKPVMDRCHRAGIRVIPYINYMELLNTEVEQRETGRKIYYEWLQMGYDVLDMKNHPDWVCINAEGKDVKSVWGSNNGYPGLYYTCFHQQALHQAALGQVRGLMEMGADGVFIDNAGPVFECYGPRFGKHTHADSGKSNTQMYESLQQEIYTLVKSFGKDKIVMQNSGIIPSHWAYSDTQMWESCMYGAGTVERMNDWVELKYSGEEHSEAVSRGKVPVILSYIDSQPNGRRRECALYSYAYSRLYGFLWADWFTTGKTAEDAKAVSELYQARLGKPTGQVKQSGDVFYRTFEKGLVVLNPSKSAVSATLPAPNNVPINDVCYDRRLNSSDGKIRLDIAAESGRALTW